MAAMPADTIPRVLEYVGLLLVLALLSTFSWWMAATLARAEYRRLLSALACSMRWFFYSVCLLVILVVLRTLNMEPRDPHSRLFAWVHLGGSALISIPCAWRSFRVRGAQLLTVVGLAWLGYALLLALAFATSASLGEKLVLLPAYLARTP